MGRARKLDTKQKILHERGVRIVKPEQYKHKKLIRLPPTQLNHMKTPTMRLIEIEHKASIEELLLSGTVTQVAARLRTNKGTISKWKHRLQLVWSADNLPKCEGCTRATYICVLGVCRLLLDCGQEELCMLKTDYPSITKEVSNE